MPASPEKWDEVRLDRRRGTLVRIALGLLVVLTIALIMRGCEPDRSTPGAIVHGLCDGLAEIEDGGVARDIYVDRVHQPIHDLEERLRAREIDPAPLTQANEWLETSLDGHTDDIPGAIRATSDAVRRSALALDEKDPGGCG